MPASRPTPEYTVSLTEFPAVTTIASTTGKPLLQADSFTFRTLPAPSPDIISNIRCNGPDGILGTPDDTIPGQRLVLRRAAPRDPSRHAPEPRWPLPMTRVACRTRRTRSTSRRTPTPAPFSRVRVRARACSACRNEGSPRIIEALSTPRHNQQAVGSPSAVDPGLIDLPAIRVKVNEPLDPLTIEPFFNGIPVNVQLWRVALKDGTPTGPDQILTNKPIVVQDTEDTEIILVPAGPVPAGCVPHQHHAGGQGPARLPAAHQRPPRSRDRWLRRLRGDDRLPGRDPARLPHLLQEP